jgi:5-methylcytosine-specific restriction endonuclease McrA
VPHKLSLPLTRRTIMVRDNYTCQYCGAQPLKADLTIDHVIPRVRGGATTWENVVCACKPCNLRKGPRTPAEANMQLCAEPGRPRYVALVLLAHNSAQQAWNKYIHNPQELALS